MQNNDLAVWFHAARDKLQRNPTDLSKRLPAQYGSFALRRALGGKFGRLIQGKGLDDFCGSLPGGERSQRKVS